jgi:2-iminoacetate synthase
MIVAILRLAVPYTGIIMSRGRRRRSAGETFALGVSQISAGTGPTRAGYSSEDASDAQFSLGDHRPPTR